MTATLLLGENRCGQEVRRVRMNEWIQSGLTVPPMRMTVHVLRLEVGTFVVPLGRRSDGLYKYLDAMVRIDGPTPVAIGAAVRNGMAQSVDGLDTDVPDFRKYRSFRATGARSWRAFERGSQMVGVSSEPGKLIVAPYRKQKEEDRAPFGRSSLTTTYRTASWGSGSWRPFSEVEAGRGQGRVEVMSLERKPGAFRSKIKVRGPRSPARYPGSRPKAGATFSLT
jgi:hypothetical protein